MQRWDGMPAFLIDPEIRVRHRRYPVLRTIAEAVEFVRGMAAEHPDAAWPAMARALERVRTEDDALEVAVEIEMLLEREAMLIPDASAPAAMALPSRAATPEPQQVSARAMSMVFATASAEPNR